MIKNWFIALSIGLIAFGAIFISGIAVDPTLSSMSRDGGAFAYCGEQIAKGALLYKDCWDNKPPAIYYLNATVFTLAGAKQWNLWLFQAIWLSITALVFFAIIRSIWTGRVAFLATMLMLLTLLYPVYFAGGNLTETYALLPIALALGAFWGYLRTNERAFLICIGFFSAIAFLFKPTYISSLIAAGMILLWARLRHREYYRLFADLVFLLLSFLLPLGLVAAYWVAKNDLNDLLYAVFIHNRLYVEQGISVKSFIATLRILIVEQPLSALFGLTLISLIVFFVENWKKSNPIDHTPGSGFDPDYSHIYITAGLTIWLALDIIFVALPGTNFRHYYQIPILTMAAICASLFFHLSKKRSLQNQVKSTTLFMSSLIVILLLPWIVEVVGKEFPSVTNWKAVLSNPQFTYYQPNEIEQFILDHSQPYQSILIWDYDPTIYFHVNRKSPTRFIFLRHLYTPIPGAVNGFGEFMQSLMDDPPILIITSKTAQQGLPYLGLSESEICNDCPPDIRQGVITFKQYVDQHYQPYADVQTWAVYLRKQ